MRKTLVSAVLLLFWTAMSCHSVGANSGEDATSTAPEKPGQAAQLKEWEPQIKKARQRLNVLSLFARLTSLKGVTVPIPKDQQRIKLEDIEGMGDVAQKVQVYLKNITFHGLKLEHPADPVMRKKHPVFAATLRASQVELEADAKTGLGTFPLEAEFENAVIPVDFVLALAGYKVMPTPKHRAKEGSVKDVKIKSNVPLAGPLLTGLLKDDLAKALLTFGVGKTLKLDEKKLLGGAGGLPLGGLDGLLGNEQLQGLISNESVQSTLESLLK